MNLRWVRWEFAEKNTEACSENTHVWPSTCRQRGVRQRNKRSKNSWVVPEQLILQESSYSPNNSRLFITAHRAAVHVHRLIHQRRSAPKQEAPPHHCQPNANKQLCNLERCEAGRDAFTELSLIDVPPSCLNFASFLCFPSSTHLLLSKPFSLLTASAFTSQHPLLHSQLSVSVVSGNEKASFWKRFFKTPHPTASAHSSFYQ